MTEPEKEPILSKQTGIQLGVAILLGGGAVGGAWNLAVKMTGLTEAVAQNTEAIREMAHDQNGDVNWNDLRAWARLLQAQNPELRVPVAEQ